MGYILNLRKQVGHEPLISTGSAALVYNASAQLLFVHRSDTHLWGLPSGSKEIGESLTETASREVFEETGVHAVNFKFITILSGPSMAFRYPNGDQIDAVIAVYQAFTQDQQLTPQTGETDKVAFFNLDQLPAQVTDFSRQILEAAELV
ncbi:NUDIX family hydrolase [Secundilactobacillus pentosiphilus]|uniref:NUDIX family hydrolase n=1 Tax=Secundilactobacillus pentosiphilus TaxID=1714682 RepID=A0A1Z5IRM4_9LACO|nr:NUDIX domain-containing protein [Secundilactobacillus pentosiphilus]GAX04389.1 NUDIX family hydrolase [Secundilactobacillus pentosiphilus]